MSSYLGMIRLSENEHARSIVARAKDLAAIPVIYLSIGCLYSGGGDEGSCDTVYFVAEVGGKKIRIREDDDTEVCLYSLFNDLIEDFAPCGYDTGNGYSGSIEIDIATLKITHTGDDREDY